MEDVKIKELQEQLLDLTERAQVIQATADGEKRKLNEDETKEVNRIFAEFSQVEEEIDRRQQIAKQVATVTASAGRKADPQEPEVRSAGAQEVPAAQPQARAARPRIQVLEDRGKWGWKHFGEFAGAVAAASARNAYVDPRLVANAPTTLSQEGVGQDGGFAVPPDFRTAIWQKIAGEASLFARTDQNPISGNQLVIPADETAPWDTSGGIQVYFESEGSQLQQSKIALQEKTIRLNKLTALVPVTEELLEDAPGLDAYLRRKVGEKFDFKLNLKLVQGTGSGEPLGILNSDSIVSVAKETSQAADTVVAENILKMWSRLYAPCRTNAVWLINQDVEPQLWSMSIKIKNVAGTENVGGVPVYMPPGGLSASPYATLMNRPVVPTQACETLGDKGDIILVDLSQYLTVYKTGGIKSDVSMHLWFDYDVLAYRFILRIAGQPWWKTAISPRDGNNTLSWAVTLDERAG